MLHNSVICPMCKTENDAGLRFCRRCGRLLIEPGDDAPQSDPTPRYQSFGPAATQGVSESEGEPKPLVNVKSARVVIRVFPSEVDGTDEPTPQHVGEYALEGRTITIGRGAQCDVVFDGDTMTSRRHAILRCEDNQYVVADLGSSNGTFVNEVEIRRPTPLAHGDRMQIGQHELLYVLEQAQALAIAQALSPTTAAPTTPDSMPDFTPDSAHDDAAPVAPDSVGADAEDFAVGTQMRPTAGPALATAKQPSVARLSSELAASASRMANPHQDDAEMEATRAKLLEASEALTRQAGAQAALAERRRATIVETRERVRDLLADLRGDDTTGDSPTHQAPQDIITLVDRVAEDPNDLHSLHQLANHADDIAHALRSQGPSEGQWQQERAQTLRTLEDILFRLQERS